MQLSSSGNVSEAKFKRVLSVAPDWGIKIHNTIIDDAIVLDMPTFCVDVVKAVRSWQEAAKDTASYRRDSELLMRWHPNGVSPYVVGPPVLT